MDADTFKDTWRRWYGDVAPVGYMMRDAHPRRWLRIHSLPEGKRYADTAAEWAELLARHDAVATAVLGNASDCLLVVPHFSWSGEAIPPSLTTVAQEVPEPVTALAPGLLGVCDDSWPGDAQWGASCVEGIQRAFYARPVTWRPGAFAPLIRAVADDQMRFLLASCSSGQVYAPYDGGADFFFRTSAERDALKRRFRAWLSDRADGL